MKKGISRIFLILFTTLITNILFFTVIVEDYEIPYKKEEEEEKEIEDQKTVYLTFDDGPSKNTLDIIKILDKYNIKATFFVVGNNINHQNKEILKKIHNEKHFIGLHTMSHNYYYLYEHPNAHKNFINEILEEQELIYKITGFKSKLIRPPYSDGKIFSNKHLEEIINLDFKYWDWNVDTEDWKANTINDIINSIEYSLYLLDNHDRLIVLFHELDITVKSLPIVIDFFIKKGYNFKAYNPDKHFPLNFNQRDY